MLSGSIGGQWLALRERELAGKGLGLSPIEYLAAVLPDESTSGFDWVA